MLCLNVNVESREEFFVFFSARERLSGDMPYPRYVTLRDVTVKPTDLMRYLCRLVTPPGGLVLDQFMGSGSTGKAAGLEGFGFVGVDDERAHCDIAELRIREAYAQGRLFA